MGTANDFLEVQRGNKSRWHKVLLAGIALSFLYLTSLYSGFSHTPLELPGKLTNGQRVTLKASLERCNALHVPAGPPPNFHSRSRSERAIEDSPPILIKNVTLWTGKPTEGDDVGEILEGVDVLASDGIIKSIKKGGELSTPKGAIVIEGNRAWLTPGIIDVHVHAGLDGVPALRGIDDTNSLKSPVTPALRSIDGVSNHDWSFVSIASGGITTGLALPGSANNVGGQAYPVKLGRLGKRAVSGGGWWRVVDPPRSLTLPGEGGQDRDDVYSKETGMKRPDGSSSFRHMKMACGENPRRIYKMTRMDESLEWRKLFTNARTLKDEQDAFCEKAMKNDGRDIGDNVTFPDDLALEAVVDVLRGKTKVNTHCYTMEDFSTYVAHTNEFKFPLAAFHHAHEAYLVPDLLKKVYGGTPAVALFSLNANYKTEAYFGSPFASTILARHNITTHMKSDHPVTDSRRLMSQVSQNHHFGLSAGRSLRGVTSSAAKTLGLDHRLGQVKAGFDADMVLWDRNPLSLGANPVEVIIDGTRQELKKDDSVVEAMKSTSSPRSSFPSQGKYSSEIKRVMEEGPEIIAWESSAYPLKKRTVKSVRLFNVTTVYSFKVDEGEKKKEIVSRNIASHESVLFSNGRVACIGSDGNCSGLFDAEETIDLQGGTIIPGLLAFGSDLGLTDISAEPATQNGAAIGLMSSTLDRAVDGLRLGGHDLRFAHASGVTGIVSAPLSQEGIKQGIVTYFDAGVEDLLEEGSIKKEEVALHLTIDHWQASDDSQPTIGQQIASIRNAIKSAKAELHGKTTLKEDSTEEENVWVRVVNGSLPLIVNVQQAETISQLIKIKENFPTINLILSRADEASLGSIPTRLKKAEIPVLITPIEWPTVYDARRALRIGGVSASAAAEKRRKQGTTTLLGTLVKEGVQVGAMINEAWRSSTLMWDVVAAGEKAGLSREESLSLASASLANILGIEVGDDAVAFDGSPFEYGAKPVAIVTPRGVDLM